MKQIKLTDSEIEVLAVEHEDYGFGFAGNDENISQHYFFNPDSLRNFVRAIERAYAEKVGIAYD